MLGIFRLLAGCVLALVIIAPTTAQAIDFTWPGHGTIHLDVPESWHLVGRQTEDIGYAFNAKPKSGDAAILQITLAAKDGMKPVDSTELPVTLHRMVKDYLSGSVESKYSPQPLPLSQGVGYFVHLTDSSLVGRPPQKDNYKAMRNAVAALDPGALAIITMQFDNTDGPEVADMMAIVHSMQFDRSKKDGAPAAAALQPFVFTRPQSKLRVVFSTLDLKIKTEREGYFLGGIASSSVSISGWLEPAHRYNGLEEFWAKESGGKIAGTLGREGEWGTVTYTTDLSSKDFTQLHLRAELVRDGTWVDLHLSTVGKSGDAELPQRLLSILRAIQVSTR